MVIGGGGGLTQPLLSPGKRAYTDILLQDKKPLYFYLVIQRIGNHIYMETRGMQKDFSPVRTFPIGQIDW